MAAVVYDIECQAFFQMMQAVERAGRLAAKSANMNESYTQGVTIWGRHAISSAKDVCFTLRIRGSGRSL